MDNAEANLLNMDPSASRWAGDIRESHNVFWSAVVAVLCL
jgi:hypothetical protein